MNKYRKVTGFDNLNWLQINDGSLVCFDSDKEFIVDDIVNMGSTLLRQEKELEQVKEELANNGHIEYDLRKTEKRADKLFAKLKEANNRIVKFYSMGQEQGQELEQDKKRIAKLEGMLDWFLERAEVSDYNDGLSQPMNRKPDKAETVRRLEKILSNTKGDV